MANLIKKNRYQRKGMDIAKMTDELGDVFWYLALLSEVDGRQLSLALVANVIFPCEDQEELVFHMLNRISVCMFSRDATKRSQVVFSMVSLGKAMAHTLGVSLYEVLYRNLEKLGARYEGVSVE